MIAVLCEARGVAERGRGQFGERPGCCVCLARAGDVSASALKAIHRQGGLQVAAKGHENKNGLITFVLMPHLQVLRLLPTEL